MTRSSGRWDNAPVVYVLAQVRTERIADVKKYLADFAGRLRDELDLAALESELVRVTSNTLEPATVSIWLRDTEAVR